ncbi:hypothetical protein EIP91_009699 [Steccherinum ochraceum]|uniref:3'-5' exonuclease n=1 Tax=Steccherinum ochraceum TaxID=92696 RepID=A0A4R0RNU7_9APHY|nr:hypothetical protein EIP91_009699 [Steccherinum ochraceum]
MSPPTQSTLPLYSWRSRNPDARIVYLRDEDAVNQELSQPLSGAWGFDLEWKPTWVKGQPENPVAIVQLANADTIYLFQVSAMRGGFPIMLRDFLQNPKIIKAGVSVMNDCKKLWKDFGVSVANCVDLPLLARTVDNAQWKGKYSQPIGLSRLCETYFGETLAKGRVQRSNWEANLTPNQQEYAANDCHSGYSLYVHLSSMISKLTLLPLPSFYSFDLTYGQAFQPASSHLQSHQLTAWRPHNPFYDPGPAPEKPARSETHSRRSASPPYTGTVAQPPLTNSDSASWRRPLGGGVQFSSGPREPPRVSKHWQPATSVPVRISSSISA